MNSRTRLYKITILVLSFVVIPFAQYTFAQVTIGNNTHPVHGALLQLKENDNQGANSNRGLLLPRVQLTGHNLDAISKDDTETAEMYTGLTVWNVRSVDDICKGVQTWTGSKWESPMPKNENKSSYDPTSGILTDHEGNTYTTASFGTAGVWMTQNLRSKTSPGLCDDVLFPNQVTENDWKYGMYHQFISYPAKHRTPSDGKIPATWKPEQGLLYSWALATDGKGGFDGKGNIDGVQDESVVGAIVKQRQGVCPDGWHLPSVAEWIALLEVLEEDAKKATPLYADYSGQTNPVGAPGAYTSMKSNMPVNGITTMPNGASKPNNKNGFDVPLVGWSVYETEVYGTYAAFWASNSAQRMIDASGEIALASSIMFDLTKVSSSEYIKENSRRSNLFSVRCKKDE